MMDKLLATIRSPRDLAGLTPQQLGQLADEMREAICRLATTRTAHFASNLGVVELAIALHTSFDFSHDRLIWDTGHQIYPHKLLTGRYEEFAGMRSQGGLMGYPNPAESDYDLFLTGHAGCAVGTVLGMQCGDDLLRGDENRYAVAVIGDGAFSSGVVLEAMNHAGGLKKNLLVILNDNKMSICPRVGGLAASLDQLRMNSYYTGLKTEVQKFLGRLPVIGDPVERFITQVKEAVKAGLLGGMLFEDLGFRYMGPVDGHNIPQLQRMLKKVRQCDGPVLLHVVTEKGHGFQPAAEDPVTFHSPAPFARRNGTVISIAANVAPSYTLVVRDTILRQMRNDPRVVVITAAMCQGNMLEPIRTEFPERFFDVGISESHAVVLAAGMAKAGLRPIVDIYSTFLQRSYDQIFQEVSLQNLPVTLLLDRAGLVGPDGPTHHGVFDLSYLRPFPNLVVLAPGDEQDLTRMLDWSLTQDRPAAIRYPKTTTERVPRKLAPMELGTAEVLSVGRDGLILACGTMLANCVAAADELAKDGFDLGVINARFVKPLDLETILPAIAAAPATITVEEGVLMGGFGSAVLEAVSDAGIEAGRIYRLGIPDRYIEHASRSDLLAQVGLDVPGIVAACRQTLPKKEVRAARVGAGVRP
jgi:1-deoxy-D-xylulose-5-phosphate synthase